MGKKSFRVDLDLKDDSTSQERAERRLRSVADRISGVKGPTTVTPIPDPKDDKEDKR